MAAHQARIPPSRRTEGYRDELPSFALDEKTQNTIDHALIFTPRASTDNVPGNLVETLEEPSGDVGAVDLSLQISRISTRRASIADTFSAPIEAEPSEKQVARKLAAAGSTDISKADLIKTFGKRKAGKILAGTMGMEDDVTYDMSLVKACYKVHKGDFWLGAFLLTLGCELRPTSAIDQSADMQMRSRWPFPY